MTRPSHPTVAKGIIVGAFTGLASIPGLYYALVVQQVERVQSGEVATVAKQDEVLRSATSTGRVLFGLGLFFLVLLVAYIVIGFRLQNIEEDDSKK
jgi:hypothetical protein